MSQTLKVFSRFELSLAIALQLYTSSATFCSLIFNFPQILPQYCAVVVNREDLCGLMSRLFSTSELDYWTTLIVCLLEEIDF